MKGFQLIQNLVLDASVPKHVPESILFKFNEIAPVVIEQTPVVVTPPCLMDCPIEQDVISIPVIECCQKEEMDAMKLLLYQLLENQTKETPQPTPIPPPVPSPPPCEEIIEDDQCKGSQPNTPCSDSWFSYAAENCYNERCKNVIDEEPFNVFWEECPEHKNLK
jgi:hypothetical protein